jgi:hypothetical protein
LFTLINGLINRRHEKGGKDNVEFQKWGYFGRRSRRGEERGGDKKKGEKNDNLGQ